MIVDLSEILLDVVVCDVLVEIRAIQLQDLLDFLEAIFLSLLLEGLVRRSFQVFQDSSVLSPQKKARV